MSLSSLSSGVVFTKKEAVGSLTVLSGTRCRDRLANLLFYSHFLLAVSNCDNEDLRMTLLTLLSFVAVEFIV
jgi:hypothetical protein